MSIQFIRDQINHFVSSDEPEVMAIKGGCGVGKTFSWQMLLEQAGLANKISLKCYSCVSLMGVDSLEALKCAILENIINCDMIGAKPSDDTSNRNIVDRITFFSKPYFSLIKTLPIVKLFTPTLEPVSFLSLKNTIICIDDLDKRGVALDVKAVLGLVSQLKEQKNCKVVLLFNDEKERYPKDYEICYEKAVDIEIALELEPKECALMAFSNQAPHYSKLQDFVTRLRITDIRVLKKIERLVTLSLSVVEEFDLGVAEQVMHSIVLYSWSYYCSDSNEDVPPLDFITSKGDAFPGVRNDEFTEIQKKWQTTLQAYNYYLTDDLDLLLVEYVKTGCFFKDEFKEKAFFKNQKIMASKSTCSFNEAWCLYHETFKNNGDDIIDGLYKSFKKNCKYITPKDLNSTVSLFRELGENVKANDIIEIYIESRKREVKLFKMEENNHFRSIKDERLIERFNDMYHQSMTTKTVKQALDQIANTNSWDCPNEEMTLINANVNEYYDVFKSEEGPNLSTFVAICLKFGQLSTSSDQQKEIANKATAALRRIALESDINKIRVRKFVGDQILQRTNTGHLLHKKIAMTID